MPAEAGGALRCVQASLGNSYLCGFSTADWNGTANVAGMPPDTVLEYLLGQCWARDACPAGQGDYLLTAIYSVANTFLGETVLQRADVQAVVQENDRLAGRPPTQPGDDLTLLDPPVVPSLLPVPTTPGLREPAVVTARRTSEAYQNVPSNPLETADTDATPYGLIATAARRGLGPYPSSVYPTTQYMDDLAISIEAGPYAGATRV